MMRIEPIEKARLEAIESKMMQEEFNLPDQLANPVDDICQFRSAIVNKYAPSGGLYPNSSILPFDLSRMSNDFGST
jgi:hypothetical protein